jgi:putative transcriptional regulator
MAVSFGQRLKELRTKAGMSQATLAENTGFDQKAISLWERGDRDPSWTAVKALARALGVSCEVFDDGPESSLPDPREIEPIESSEQQPKRRKKVT